MVEPWKTVLCDSKECISEMFDAEEEGSPTTKLDQATLEKYKIYPDLDNEVVTQFTCPRCGKVQTWGITRRNVAKILYERMNNR
jgi:hypothetical protein